MRCRSSMPTIYHDDERRTSASFTLVSAEDIERGRWRFNAAIASSLAVDPDYAQRQLLHYARALKAGGKYALTIWPYHSMLGGIGHALVSAVEEAIFFHGIDADAPDFQVKGNNPHTEHYSVIGPEVTKGPHGEVMPSAMSRSSSSSTGMMRSSSQAKPRAIVSPGRSTTSWRRYVRMICRWRGACTCWRTAPRLWWFRESSTTRKQADPAFRRFAEAGLHVVRSTEPLARWPGLEATGA